MVLFRDGIQALTKRYDMCLVGSDGVGKSTLIVHYIYDRFIPDIEDLDALYTKRVVTPDTGGSFQEISIFESDYNKDLYSESREMHILNANTLILVYSIANLKSFIDLEDYYSGIIQLRGPHDIPPICLIGTKFDLESSSREVSYYDGADFAKKINAVAFHECSSKESFAIKDSFEKITDLAVKIRLDLDKKERVTTSITGDDELELPKSNVLSLYKTYDSVNSDFPLPGVAHDIIDDRIDPIDDLHHDKQELQEKQINQTKKPQQLLDQDQSPNDCPLPRSSHSKLSSTTSTTKKIRNPIHVMRSKSIERDSSSLKASSKKHGCCVIT